MAKNSTTSSLPLGTVDQILHAADVPEEVVPVPEWGCSVRMRGITLKQYHDARAHAGEKGDVSTHLLIESIVEPQFTHDQAGVLASRSFSVLTRLSDVAMRLSRLGRYEIDQMEATFPEGAGDPVPDAAGEGPGENA